MSRPAVVRAQDAPAPVARTIRFPAGLREKIAADAERCGRSFDGQVIALLRRHYGEDVDIAPNPAEILALAVASFADVPAAELGSADPETPRAGKLSGWSTSLPSSIPAPCPS